MIRLEMEHVRTDLAEAQEKGKELQAALEAQSAERAQGMVDNSLLSETIQGLRMDLARKDAEIGELVPTVESLQAELQQAKRRMYELEAEARRVPALQVMLSRPGDALLVAGNVEEVCAHPRHGLPVPAPPQQQASEAETLKARSLELEKELLVLRATTDTERVSATVVTQEVEKLRREVAKQERLIESLEPDARRARVLEDEVSMLRKRVEDLRGEAQEATAELACSRREQRHCLTHTEGLLNVLSRSSRDCARDACNGLLETLFSPEHQDMAESLLWVRLRALLEEVASLLGSYWTATDSARRLEERNTQLEAQSLTMLSRIEGTESELSRVVAELQQAKAFATSLEADILTQRGALQRLQASTAELESDLRERDRFLCLLHARITRSCTQPHGPLARHHLHHPPAAEGGEHQAHGYASLDSHDPQAGGEGFATPTRRLPEGLPPDMETPRIDSPLFASLTSDVISTLTRLEDFQEQILEEARRKESDFLAVRKVDGGLSAPIPS